MRDGTLMEVLFCITRCPFICLCKPPAAHLYTSAPLKVESSPRVAFAVNKLSSRVNVEKQAVNGNEKAQALLKSCIPNPQGQEAGKKRVQWMDNIGKQLAEIKEFESSETGDTENEDDSSRCVCIIL